MSIGNSDCNQQNFYLASGSFQGSEVFCVWDRPRQTKTRISYTVKHTNNIYSVCVRLHLATFMVLRKKVQQCSSATGNTEIDKHGNKTGLRLSESLATVSSHYSRAKIPHSKYLLEGKTNT